MSISDMRQFGAGWISVLLAGDVRTALCCCGMNTLPGSALNHFQSGPLSNNHSAILRQQFAYLCVPLERDYHQKLDLLQIWWKEAFYKWLIEECIFSLSLTWMLMISCHCGVQRSAWVQVKVVSGKSRQRDWPGCEMWIIIPYCR